MTVASLPRSAALSAIATQLLAREGSSTSAEAAGRVYGKIQKSLSPLLGSAGVQTLLLRAAKLLREEFAWLLEPGAVDSPAQLQSCLRTREPVVAARAAEALFGTFFTLVATFIGERLTIQVLRTGWPFLMDDIAPPEPKQ